MQPNYLWNPYYNLLKMQYFGENKILIGIAV